MAMGLLGACGSGPHELRLVTPAAQVDRDIARTVASLLAGSETIKLELADGEFAGAAALEALAAGQADLALVSNNLRFRDDVATVMPLYQTVLHIARRGDRAARDIPELFRGASIYAGAEGSASRLVFERVVARTGMTRDDYAFTSEFGPANDLVIVFAPISPDRVQQLSGFVLASMGRPEDIGSGGIIDAAVLLNPQFRPFVFPAGTYGPVTPEPVVTVAVDNPRGAPRPRSRGGLRPHQ